jgi:nucleoside-diphosphate-sugar epimerase
MIYILGGDGFVGSAFARYCQTHNLEFKVVERDSYDQFVGSSCDVLINANGNSKKFLAREDPMEEFSQSVRSVRASLVDIKAGLYVHLSTCDVYPDCSSPDTTRETLIPDVATQSAYGFHKYLAEQCVRHAASRWLIARLGGMVGPGMKKNPVFDILHGQPLWLDPASRLQFMHTDAVGRTIFDLIDRSVAGEVINICGAGLVSLSEIGQLAGNKITAQPNSPRVRYEVSIEKLQAILPVPQTQQTLEDFLRAA